MVLNKFIGMSVLLTGALLTAYLWNLEQSQFDFQAQADMRSLLLWQQVITSVVLLSFILKGLNIKLIKSGWHIFPFVFVSGPILVILKYDQIEASLGGAAEDFEKLCNTAFWGVFAIFIIALVVRPLLIAMIAALGSDKLNLGEVKTIPRPINIPPIVLWVLLFVGWGLIYRNYALVEAAGILTDEQHLKNLLKMVIKMLITLLVVLLIIRPLIKRLHEIEVPDLGYNPEYRKNIYRENRKKILHSIQKSFPKHFIHLCFIILAFVALKFFGGSGPNNWPVSIGILYSFVAVTYYFSFGATHLETPADR